MRRYPADEERRIRLQANVRAWSRAGLLDAAQASMLDARLRTDLKQTNDLLRASLAFFTAIIVAATVGLLFVTLGVRTNVAAALLLLLAALCCVVLAEYLSGPLHRYRYGAEEALAVCAVILAAASAIVAIDTGPGTPRHLDLIVALAVAAAGGFAVYRRYGLVYAAIGAMICGALVPFALDLGPARARTCAAALLGAVVVAARAGHLRAGDDVRDDECATLQASACAGVYLTLNLQVADGFWIESVGRGWFYWATYAATWIIPAAALATAIREKDRALLTVGLAIALVTLATNKPYLGLDHQAWDPMLLGVLLVGVAAVVRRWLARGPGDERHGYTATRILQTDRDVLSAVANVSVAWPRDVDRPQTPNGTPPSAFDGGRSGGGGGGASY
jgi:hypothetical protein